MYEADDGEVTCGPGASQTLMRDIDAVQNHNRRVLQRLSPLQVHFLKRRLATGRWPVSHPPVDVAVAAPRRQGGPSGRPRAQASRSSAASGDGPEDPEPPSRARPGAERLLSKLARGLDEDALTAAAQLIVALDAGAL
jgi:hypothetical protein